MLHPPFQPHLILHPYMKLGPTHPWILLLFLDPSPCTASRPLPVLRPRPGLPFLRSPSCQNAAHPSRPSSKATSSVKLSLVPSGRINPSFLSVPTVNGWNLFLAYFILPHGIYSSLYLFLPY